MSFLTRLVGPLLARELVRLARGPALRPIIVAAPCFLLLLMIAEGRARWTEGTKEQTAAAAAHFVSQTFFMAGVVLALALPLWICPTIVRERSEGGFDLILTTQLSIVEVLLGVAGAAAAVSAVVAASLAPVVSMMTLFGGVDPYSVAAKLLTLALEVICLTGGCLQAAAAHRSPIRATLIGAGQGLAAFLLLAIFAFPALEGISRIEASGWGKIVILTLMVLLFLGIAGAMFNGWLSSATDSFRRADVPILPTRVRRTDSDAPQNSPDARRSAMWGPLKLRLDDSEPTRLQIRVIWFIYLGLAMPLCWVIRMGQGETVAPLLLLIWVCVQPFIIVVAATNPLLSRRPGFFDDLLTTNLPNKEILSGVMWIVQPALIRLLAVPIGLAIIWLALNPAGNAVATLVGVAWTAELVLVGALLSLADHRLNMRLLGILGFWAVTALGPFFARTLVSTSLDQLLYVATVSLLVAFALRRRTTWGRLLVACLLAHVAFASLGAWFGAKLLAKSPPNPLDLLSPVYWMSHCLWQAAQEWDSFQPTKSNWSALAALPFAVSLTAVVVLFWRYAVRRFDQLVGRTHTT